jgi:hypothetical protein
MKEPKYYYPEPESIYIGMECERKVSEHRWAKRTFTREDFLNYIPFSDTTIGENSFAQKVLEGEDIIRVKCLDHYDLQELCGEIKEELNDGHILQHSGIYEGKEIVMVTDDFKRLKNHAYVSIYTGLGNAMFRGRLKNKQELLRILEMIE